MDSGHQQLLLHTEVWWLPHTKVLSWLFKLRDEIHILPWSEISIRTYWALTWLFLVSHAGVYGRYLQSFKCTQLEHTRRRHQIFSVEDKIEAMIKNIELWARCLSKTNFDYFQNLKTFLESVDEKLWNYVLGSFTQHLQIYAMHFLRVLSTSRWK